MQTSQNWLALALLFAPFQAQAAPLPEALLRCRAVENGRPARARLRIVPTQAAIWETDCDGLLTLPQGTYSLDVTLIGAFDRPISRHHVVLEGNEQIVAEFETGQLVVELTRSDKLQEGRVELTRDARAIGSAAAGAVRRLSVGSYGVRASSGAHSRGPEGVSIVQRERRVLRWSLGDASATSSQ